MAGKVGRPPIGPFFGVRLTRLQLLHLRLSAAVGNESVAAVLRRLIAEDMRQRLLKEVQGVTEEGHSESAVGSATGTVG
jgi:methionine salvage enolase-phosphatase E1